MKTLEKDLIVSLYILCIIISIILNINLIAAFILKDWQWILDNWLNGALQFIIPLYYLLVHFILIFGYKITINRLKSLDIL